MPNKSISRTPKNIVAENEDLRARLDEAEETLRAIRSGDVDALIVSGLDGERIFTLRQAEEALEESEEKFRRLVEHLPSVVYMNAVGDSSSTLYVSPQITTQLGYTQKEWLANPRLWSKTLHPEDREHVLAEAAKSDRTNGPFDMEYRMIARDGHLVWVHDQAILVHDLEGQPKFRQGIMLDITARKQAEETLQKEKDRAQQYLDIAGVMFLVLDADRKVILINKKGCEILGYTEDEILGRNWVNDFLPQADRDEHGAAFDRIMAGQMELTEYYENPVLTKSGEERLIAWHNSVLTDETGRIIGSVSSGEDVTERKRAEIEIHQRLSELEVLYQSGLALSQLVSPKAIAQKMIDLLDQKMDWHHTAVRLYNPQNATLELLVFNQPNLNSEAERHEVEERLRTSVTGLGGGFSGWVIQNGEAVRSNDLENDPRYFETFPGLQSGLYVPIKITDRVIGVISIESELRNAFHDSDERLAITLATQAAIAIENAQLFENLKYSNIDLASAYDATIEGWSHALDLRDKETEGHSRRVTDMTLRLAHTMGMSAEELVYVRWGALLHDIGKMGVPDGILLKPSPLTEEEWVAMKKHPALAYEMLSPIHYLRLALDIPYCHHEKWDGSGYPRGLAGTQIPLVARIFAVVDVWDALSSDRPYRAAWPEEKVREQILASSGTHFDPQVVEAFMLMIPEKVAGAA